MAALRRLLLSVHSRKTFVFSLSSGLFAGYFVCCIVQFIVMSCFTSRSLIDNKSSDPVSDRHGVITDGNFGKSLMITDTNLLLVGVMTAKVFLNTRAKAAYDTWVKSIPGRVIFFSSEGSLASAPPGLPLVGLRGVDDSYPPQKKSFMMLKYMHDHYINDFAFFMRADDDVYIKGEALSKLLHSINSSRALFIGQAGLGTKEEYGMLHLKSKENFCMGGPGVILTRTTLRRVVPHISHCLSNLFTSHEDVELGRCISRFAKVSCTWSYEMQKILYNNYNEPNGTFSHTLKDTDIHNAATLHPVKNHSYQYRLAQYFLSRRATSLRNDLSRLQREVNSMNEVLQDRDEYYSPNRLGLQPSLMKTVPKHRGDVLAWDFLANSVYSAGHLNPRHGFEVDRRLAVDDITMQVMELINENVRQRGRSIEYRDLLYGYSRVNPLHGADYILDLLLFYKKFKGKRKLTVPVRRHAYVQQPFLQTEFIEDEDLRKTFGLQNNERDFSLWDDAESKVKSPTDASNGQEPTPTVNFIMPLAGRSKTLLQFLKNFEEQFLSRGERVSLAVMLFRSTEEEQDTTEEISSHISSLQQKYPHHRLICVLLPGPFSRGLALQRGSSLYQADDLLFFVDVDIYVNADFIHRVRYNTVQNRQVYYPIVFSQYDPRYACDETDFNCSASTSPFRFDSRFGYWRQFGYGIASMYNSDLQRVGGWDVEIKGWGKEDVDLLQRFLDFNISVFRSVDVGLVHTFHSKICDPSLDASQYRMCVGTMAASFASIEKLAEIVYNTPEILHRNELRNDTTQDPL